MKLLKSIFVIVLATLVMCACWNEKYEDIVTYGTVGQYITINRKNEHIDVWNIPSYKVLAVETENNKVTIKLSIHDRDITNIESHALYKDDGVYQECIERFGDYNPNPVTLSYASWAGGWYVTDKSYPLGSYPCAYEIIHKIEIKSSADWDAEHPAGTSLNDIFTIIFHSVYPYIKRGWTGSVATYIKKPADEIEIDDMTLLTISSTMYVNNADILLISEKLPTTAGTHTIFVTLTLDTGEQIEYSTDYTFE
ncbi:MAG: hypothetical protein IJE21_03825 [Alistipes sp.]|nr:hypothetical protein [Alistipes sp.]